MDYHKIADAVAYYFIERRASSSTLNHWLLEQAQENGIELPHTINLVDAAVGAAGNAGANHDQAEEMAIEAIGRLTFKEKLESEKEYSQKYIKTTVLPNMVVHWKSKRKTLEQIKKDTSIAAILHKYDIPLSYIDRCFKGEIKSNRPTVTMDVLLKKKLPKDNVFDLFDQGHGADFISYWRVAVRNQVRHILDERYNQNKLLEEALSITPDDDSEDVPYSVGERHIENPDSDIENIEYRDVYKKLLRISEKYNPNYPVVLELLKEGHNLLGSDSFWQDKLKMSPKQFKDFKVYFLKDLKELLHEVGVTNYEDGVKMLRLASDANRQLLKALLEL